MKIKFCILCSLLFSLFSLNAIGQDQSPAALGVAAIGLVVSDIDRSEKFYTEILGMVPAGSFSLDETWSNEAGAANGKPFSVKMFKMVDGPSATILKLAYFEDMDDRPSQDGVNSYAGVNYLTFHYSDLSEVAKRAENAGYKRTGWVKRDGYQLFFIRDPDGVFIELVGPPD